MGQNACKAMDDDIGRIRRILSDIDDTSYITACLKNHEHQSGSPKSKADRAAKAKLSGEPPRCLGVLTALQVPSGARSRWR